jgi:hypothetical protein
VGAKPFYGGAHGGVYGSHAEAQFLLRAGGGRVHFLAAHADLFERGAGLLSEQPAR